MLFTGCNGGDANAKELTDSEKRVQEFLKTATVEDVNKAILCRGDLTGDGSDEFVMTYKLEGRESLYLIDKVKEKYQVVSEITTGRAREYKYTMAEIGFFDKGEKPYLSIGLGVIQRKTNGHVLYQYNDSKIELVRLVEPETKKYITNEFKDIDGNGIYESVKTITLDDFQQHIIEDILPLGLDKGYKKIRYAQNGAFIEKASAPDVVRNYIENRVLSGAEYLKSENDMLTLDYFSSDFEMGHKSASLSNHTIDLNIIQVGEDVREDGTVHRIYEATSRSEGQTITDYYWLIEFKGQWRIASRQINYDSNIIIVDNVRDFVKAIKPNTRIQLKNKKYDLNHLEDVDFAENQYVDNWNQISNIENLVIEGLGDTPVELYTSDGYSTVLIFNDCANIALKNLNIGHIIPIESTCSGNVIELNNCEDVLIDQCELYGCGTRGLNLYNVHGMKFANSVIYECSMEIMTLMKSSNIVFENSTFRDNNGSVVVELNCENIKFNQCSFSAESNIPTFSYGEWFDPKYVTLRGIQFRYNDSTVATYHEVLEPEKNVVVTDSYYYKGTIDKNYVALKDQISELSLNTFRNVSYVAAEYPKENEINIRFQLDKEFEEIQYRDLWAEVMQFSEPVDIFEGQRFSRVRFTIDGLDDGESAHFAEIIMDKTQFNQYIKNGNGEALFGYSEINIYDDNLSLDSFLDVTQGFIPVNGTRKRIQEMLNCKGFVDTSPYAFYEDPILQEIVFDKFQIKDGSYKYHFEITQLQPFGTYCGYKQFAELEYDVVNDVIVDTNEVTGAKEVATCPDDIKDFLCQLTNLKANEYYVDEDLSMFLLLSGDSENTVVKTQLFSRKNNLSRIGYYTLKKVDGNWTLVNLGDVESPSVKSSISDSDYFPDNEGGC